MKKRKKNTSNLNQTGHTLEMSPVPHCTRDLALFTTLFQYIVFWVVKFCVLYRFYLVFIRYFVLNKLNLEGRKNLTSIKLGIHRE
jgi:hypothetical protein